MKKDFDMLERYYKLAINFKKNIITDGDGAFKIMDGIFLDLARVDLHKV